MPLSAAAQDVTVTFDQANILARQAFAAKDFVSANKLSYSVLQQRPDDPAALVMAAATDPALGQGDRGWRQGRRAFKLAKDPTLRFEAAYFTASAAVSEERYNSAKYWLRRAYQVAPNDAAKARVGQLFKGVAQRSPLTVNLNFDISPSSNINNGSREDSFQSTFNGGSVLSLSPDAQALSGLQYSASAAFQYKLSETASKRTTLNFGLQARYYSLSSSSKADLKAFDDAQEAIGFDRRNITAADFKYETIYAGLRQQIVAKDQKSSLSYGFTLGQSWYGGNSLSRFIGGNISRVQVLNPTRSVQYGLSAQRQSRIDSKRRSSNIVGVNAALVQQFKGSGRLSFGGYVRDTNSPSNEVDNTSIGLNLSYRFENPVFAKTQLELSMDLQRSEYETSVFYDDRIDNRLSLSSTLTFADINYFGFSPTATISAARTNSTVDRFSTETLGINIGLRSSF